MRYFISILVILLFIGSCGTTKEPLAISDQEKQIFNKTGQDTVTIANEETAYEIIIIEPGFNYWLNSVAKPRGFYSQSFFETRNRLLVSEWNQRVLQPQRFDPSLYELQINYDPQTDYGYEVNYQLYNYFIYFQRKYNQRLSGFVPRI